MDFFGIGFPELLLILFIALMIFGPDKLPEIARALGRGMRKLRMITTELTREITDDFNKEIMGAKDGIREAGDEASLEIKNLSDAVKEDLELSRKEPVKENKPEK